MPASNIYTYIFEKPFDCTTTAILVTCTLFSHHATHHRRRTETHHSHPLCFLIFWSTAFPYYFLSRKSSSDTQHFLFLYPKITATPSVIRNAVYLSTTTISSNAANAIKQKTNKNLFWFPPFGMKNYSLSISLLHFCQTIKQPYSKGDSFAILRKRNNSWAFCFGTTCLFPITILSLLWCL